MKNKIDLNKFKEVVGQLKTKQKQLQGLVSRETLTEARKYAEKSGAELKRLVQSADLKRDVKKVKSILLRETGELAKLTRFVEGQRKELEKLLKSVNALEAAEFLQNQVTQRVRQKVVFAKKTKSTVVAAKRAPRKAAAKEASPGKDRSSDASAAANPDTNPA